MLNRIISKICEKIHYKQLILIASLFLVFLLVKGYAYGVSSQTEIIPNIYRMANPNFLAGDWYMDTLVIYHVYFQLFYAKLMQFIELPLLFLISYCIALVLYIIGLKKLSKILFKQDWPFYIFFVLLLVWSTRGIEGNSLFNGHFVHPPLLFTPIAIMSIAYFFEDKMVRSFVFAAIATIIHLQAGVDLFGVLLVSYIILNFSRPLKLYRGIRIPLLLYFIIVAWPLMLVLKIAFATNVSGGSNVFIEWGRFRAPHHMFISTLGGFVVNFALLCFLGLIGFINKKRDETDKKSAVFVLVIFIGVLLYFTFVEIIPINLLSKLFFYRTTIFVSMLALMYFANYLYGILTENKSVIAFFIVLAAIFSKSALAAIMLMLAASLIIYGKKEFFREVYAWAVISIISLIFAIGVIFHYRPLEVLLSLVIRNLSSFSIISVMAAIILGGILYVLISIKKLKLPKHTLFIIPLVVLLASTAAAHIQNGLFYNIQTQLVPSNDWQELGLWIRNNTDKGSFFIIPPYLSGFYLWAERSELADFDGDPILEKDILIWKERLEDVTGVKDVFKMEQKGFGSLKVFKEGYNSLSKDKIRRLAKKYSADYIIFEKPKKLSFEILHESRQFVIYKIPTDNNTSITK